MTYQFLFYFAFTLFFFKAFGFIENYNDSLARTQWDVQFKQFFNCLKFSIIAYCKKELIESWTCGSDICGLHSVADIQVIYEEQYNVLGYVLYYPKLNSIQVILRGTMPLSLKDMLKDDADYFLEAYPYCVDCKVASGFWQSFQTIEAQLVLAVKKLKSKYPTAKINVSGHSLGAAYAAVYFFICNCELKLMGASLYQIGISIDTIYTFGQPRVGNKALANWFDSIFPSNYARIVHHRDIVPHAYLEDMGFIHMNTEVFYDYSSSSYKICDETEDSKCSDQYPIELCDIVPGHVYYMGKDIIPLLLKCSDGIDFLK